MRVGAAAGEAREILVEALCVLGLLGLVCRDAVDVSARGVARGRGVVHTVRKRVDTAPILASWVADIARVVGESLRASPRNAGHTSSAQSVITVSRLAGSMESKDYEWFVAQSTPSSLMTSKASTTARATTEKSSWIQPHRHTQIALYLALGILPEPAFPKGFC